jgi:hypothetical protein
MENPLISEKIAKIRGCDMGKPLIYEKIANIRGCDKGKSHDT